MTIKLKFAGPAGIPQGTGPLRGGGAGAQQAETGRLLAQGLNAFADIQQRNGEIASRKKILQVKEGSNALMEEAILNSTANDNDTSIRVDSTTAFNKQSNRKNFTDWVMSEYDSRQAVTLKGFEGTTGFLKLQDGIAVERLRVMGAAQAYEATQTRKLRLTMLGESALSTSRLVRRDPFQFDELNDDFHETVKLAKISGIDQKLAGNKFSKQFAFEAAEGFIDLDAGEALEMFKTNKWPEGLAFMGFELKGEPGFMKHLSGEQIAGLEKQAETRQKQNLAVKKSQIVGFIDDHFASLRDTGQGVPGIEEKVQEAFANEPQKIAAFDLSQQTAAKMYGIGRVMKDTTIGSLETVLSTLKPTPGSKNFLAEKSLFDSAQREVSRQRTLAKSDPARLIAEDFREQFEKGLEEGMTNAELTEMSLAYQEAKGIPERDRRILTVRDAGVFVETVTKTNGGQQTLDALEAIRANFDEEDGGAAFGDQVMAELARDPKFSAMFSVVASNVADTTDQNARSTAFDVSRAIKVQEESKKAFTSQELGEMKDRVNVETKDWATAMMFGRPEQIKTVNDLRESIAITARMYVTKDGDTMDAAVERATANILGNKLAPDGIFFSNITNGVIVPRAIKREGTTHIMNAEFVEDQLEWLPEQILEKKFGLDFFDELGRGTVEREGNAALMNSLADRIDMGQTVRIGTQPSKTELADPRTDVSQAFARTFFTGDFVTNLQREALKELTFRTTKDGENVMLMIKFKNQTLPVLDKNREKITFPMTEINQAVESKIRKDLLP